MYLNLFLIENFVQKSVINKIFVMYKKNKQFNKLLKNFGVKIATIEIDIL